MIPTNIPSTTPRRKPVASRKGGLRLQLRTWLIALGLALTTQPMAIASGALEKWSLQRADSSFPILGDDGSLFILSGKRLLRVDPQTGTTAWSFFAGGEPIGGILTATATGGSTGKLFAVTYSLSLYSLDPQNGEVRWEFQGGRAAFLNYPPKIAQKDGLVFVPGGSGTLYALDSDSGQQKWRFDLPSNSLFGGIAFGSSGQMIFGETDGSTGAGWVRSLDVTTGTSKWRFKLPVGTVSRPTPAIDLDGTAYLTTDTGTLIALDGATGTKRWDFTIAPPLVNLTAPLLDKQGQLYFGTASGQLYAIDTKSHLLKWKTASMNPNPVITDPALSSDGLICWALGDTSTNTGTILALDRETGSVKWSSPLRGFPSSPAVTGKDGSIYVADYSGQVQALVSGQVTRATATATAQTFNGFVVGTTITSSGAGYTNTPHVNVIGGGGNGAVLTARVANGVVVGVDVFDAGRGYTSTPKILIDPPVPYPAPSKAIATLTGDAVSSVTVLEPGYGYDSGVPPRVSLVGGGGEGAVGVAVVENGAIIGIDLISGGSGYTSPPSVQIEAPEGLAFVTIGVSRVAVTLHLTAGFIYQLQSSPDFQTWTNEGIPFLAVDDVATRTFDVGPEKQYYRLVTGR